MDLRIVPESSYSVTIDETNFSQIKKNQPALEIPIYWHKFFIKNTYGLTRNVVLKILLDYIKPLEFIPLCYTQNGNEAYFFARICKQVVEKLCKEKLTIPNPFDANKPLRFRIILKYSSTNIIKLNITKNLNKVLKKRFKNDNLNLKSFVEDPNLDEFLPLSQPKLLAFVLNTSKKFNPKTIQLCKNEIASLEAFRILKRNSISGLDLRNNLLNDLAELKNLQHLRINELWLEGNPLCALYDEYNYVQQILVCCPTIHKLDGFLLRQNGFPSFRRNFLCDLSVYSVINHFLETYFPLFDLRNLSQLKHFYHSNALFSLTADIQKARNSRLALYKKNSRNLLNLSASLVHNLFDGRSEIMNLFGSFPCCEHDPLSFTVDVLVSTSDVIILTVSGVFREFPETDQILGFNRFFVLEKRADVFKISNEQIHVFEAFKTQKITAFRRMGVLDEARNLEEKIQMIEAFSLITNLFKEWSQLFLEECKYNMKQSLLLFVEQHRSNRIPSRAFLD